MARGDFLLLLGVVAGDPQRARTFERSDMNRRSRFTSFQSTYSMLSVVRMLVFFLAHERCPCSSNVTC